jgi:DNA-binding CsgD family transcriptional regulator
MYQGKWEILRIFQEFDIISCALSTTLDSGSFWDMTRSTPAVDATSLVTQAMLTPRERDAVHLAAKGMRNQEISNKLNLSEHTVRNYMLRISDKLGLSSRVELLLYAFSGVEGIAASAGSRLRCRLCVNTILACTLRRSKKKALPPQPKESNVEYLNVRQIATDSSSVGTNFSPGGSRADSAGVT